MSTRRAVPAVLAAAFAFLFFALGNYLGARQSADSDDQFVALRAEIAHLKRKSNEVTGTTGTIADALAPAARRRDARVDRRRREAAADGRDGPAAAPPAPRAQHSFVELYSYDDRGSSSYGTAGYLGEGYFITVKHGVVALNQPNAGRAAQDHLGEADVQGPAADGPGRRLRRRARSRSIRATGRSSRSRSRSTCRR